MLRVLIADDHAVVREGLKDILAETSQFKVVSEARSTDEVLSQIQQSRPDVVILDISMPNGSALDVLGQIKRDWPKLPVLVLSMYSEEEYGVRMLRAGASGYLMKDAALQDLLRALNKVVSGGKFVSTQLAEHLAEGLGSAVPGPIHEVLSNREYAVFRLIAEGRSVKEIGEQLSLSVKTISTYRGRILEKTGLRNNAEIVRYAIEHQLV
jgi:DNA-binding NarL/FixJ family response regulator